MPDTQNLVPTFRVQVNGSDLPLEAASDLLAVTVEEDVAAPGMFTLELINWDPDKLEVTWADDELFAEGNEVTIEMGYVDQLDTLLEGEITGLEPAFEVGETPTVTVRGHDLRHRLLRGRKTRSFTQVTDSDVATRVAGGQGLGVEAESTGVTLDYVLQRNQTDLEFLTERARRIGYEVAMEGKVLLFRSFQNAAGEVLTLARNADLVEFHPRLTTFGQVDNVTVRGWSVRDKKAIVGEAAAGDEGAAMGGGTSGLRAAEEAFGAASTACVDRPVLSQAEADQMARGRLKEVALAHVTAEGVALGRSDLQAGTVIGIEGVGERFSGPYYVVSTRHVYHPRRGYRTAFSARRNAT